MHLRHLNTKILASISSINLDQNPAPHLTKQPTQPTKISRKASNKLSCTTHKCTRRFRTYILCFSRVVSPKNQCNKPEKLTLNMNKSNPRFIQNGGRDISIWKFPNKGCRCCLFLSFSFFFSPFRLLSAVLFLAVGGGLSPLVFLYVSRRRKH